MRRKSNRCNLCNQPIAFLADDRGKSIMVEPVGIVRGQVRFNSAQHKRHDCPNRREAGIGWQRTMDVLSR